MKFFRLVILCLILSSCLHRESNEPYIESDFKGYTGIESGYKITKIIFQSNQSLLYVTITNNEKQFLKKNSHFLTWDDFLLNKYYHSGRIHFELYDFGKRNYNYTYYIADGLAPDEYFIICLSKDKNEMIYCENFREPPLGFF